MDIFSNQLWMLGFLAIIHQAQAYASGGFPQSCDSMLVEHDSPAQNGPIPFEVQTFKAKQDLITVTLKSTGSKTFTGFMLEARSKVNDCIVGKFIILDSQSTRFLNCNNSAGSAVSQKVNNEKTLLKVNWTAEAGDAESVIFRATFVENYATFWNPVDFNVAIPSPSPTTMPGSTTAVTETTAAADITLTITEWTRNITVLPIHTTEFSTMISTKPEGSTVASSSNQYTTTKITMSSTKLKPHTTVVLPSISTSQSSSLGTSTTPNREERKYTPQMASAVFVISFVLSVPLSFPNNAKYHNIHKWTRILSCVFTVSLALSASVLVVVKDSLNSVNIGIGFAMTVTAVITFVLQMFVCFRIGRSHELKEFFDLSSLVLFVIQEVFAIIFIYQSTKHCQIWILGVLITLTVWIGLQMMYIITVMVLEVTGVINKTGMQTLPVRITITVPIFFTVAFCVAIIVGICQC
ncbi:uncharacterized protein LOC110167834 isoform X1 [Boleophthalmus pectinirostris]|uniref:uncharacterized protein LOC110167834 isoform X1 n=1 Tax=Boleophthalmus pectinirostris TaxID=150288 RepID=UPI002430C22A|nr:uncharacterized protein LOC110167834 isoform X1 [Boleophthalmus pectinirostris]